MEPPRKRQRLLEPAPTSESNQSGNQPESHVEYDNYDNEDDYEEFDEDGDAEFDEDEDVEFDYGESEMVPYGFKNRNEDFNLAERRARIDQKLKSKWEMLFEKFSKDFTGIGDEIDFATGEVVVDNGHLKSMQDERDIGYSVSGRSLLRALTVEPEGLSALVPLTEVPHGGYSGSISQDEDEDMEENAIRTSTEICQEEEGSSASGEARVQPKDLWDSVEITEDSTAPSGKDKDLPSREEILERFGELGPKVIQLLDQQQGNSNQDNIEPAWRAPELPSRVSGKRPVLQSVFLQETDDERSPSPEQGTSLWATPSELRRRISNDVDGHSSDNLFSFDSPSLRQRKPKQYFTELDDEILLKEMTKAKKRGVRIDRGKVWADIAIAYPHHSEKEWYCRWYNTRRVPAIQRAVSLGATPDEIKEWKFDGLEWISRNPAHLAMSSDSQASRTVEYVKRVIRTERQGAGEYQNTDVHTFVGVMISETDRKKALRPTPHRFQELSSHQLGRSSSPLQYEHDDLPLSSPSRTRSVSTKRPNWQIAWNEANDDIESAGTTDQSRISAANGQPSVQNSTKRINNSRMLGPSPVISSNMAANTKRTASEDLFDKLKILYARPVRSKNLSLLQLAPGEQYVSVSEEGHESHFRLVLCPHRHCRKPSTLYRAVRTDRDEVRSEFETHLRDEHDFSMYPCLEDGCDRKGKHGFRKPGKLITHVKAAHNSTGAWVRLQRIIDPKTFPSNGIYFDEPIADTASTSDAVDELQDESIGLGIQLEHVDDGHNVHRRATLEGFDNASVPSDVQGAEPVESLASASSPQQLPEASLLFGDQQEPPNSNEDITVPLDQESSSQFILHDTSTSSDPPEGGMEAKVPPVSSDLTSSSKTSIPLSPPEKICPLHNYSSSPILGPIRRYPLRKSTTSLPKWPKANEASSSISSEPDIPDSAAAASSVSDVPIPQPDVSPKNPFIKPPRRSLPMEIADADELDELSILSPSLTPSLMSCHSITISRTPSRVSSPFPSHPTSTPSKKLIPRHPRHSLPMSAIPSRSVPKTSRKSLSGYNYKAPPSSSLRNMMMPSTPTKNKRKRNANSGAEDEEVDEVFKTPGGTLRRCGKEGFFCGREFCFRCVVRDGK